MPEDHLSLWTLLSCPPGVDECQECGVTHSPTKPHFRTSIYYQVAFYLQHGRWPTWRDAMHHCTAELQALWILGRE